MIFPFVELPRSPGGWPRPVLDVVVGNMAKVLVPCLVDSGASNTLLPDWVADLAGIDCEGAPTKSLAVAGAGTRARMVTTLLTIGDHSWESEVGFCEPWPHGKTTAEVHDYHDVASPVHASSLARRAPGYPASASPTPGVPAELATGPRPWA